VNAVTFGIMDVTQWDIPLQSSIYRCETESEASNECAVLNLSARGSTTYLVVPVYVAGGRVYLDKSKMEAEA